MHLMSCTCPTCLSKMASEFEFASLQSGEMSEQEELELAMELLSVQNEYEMEQFLGSIVSSIGRGLKSIGKVAMPALKSLAKAALPIAGGALGSFIPIPGVGSMIGGALGRAAANALELELAGMDPAQADIEKSRRIVRVLRSAAHELSRAPGSAAPEAVVRSALTSAIRRNIPNVKLSATQAAGTATTLPPAAAATASGRWWRRGHTIVVDGG